MPEHTIKIEGTGTTTNYHFTASGPMEAADDTEWNDDTPDNEAHGQIVGGTDTYSFGGVPVAFWCDDAVNAWSLDIALDMGAGFAEQTPQDLNAGHIEVRGKGHYRLFIPEPGMILRGSAAEWNDEVMTGGNTIVAGNVRGFTDSWRAWPVEAVTGKADQNVEYRIANNKADDSWRSLETIRTAMGEM